jgi:Protein of unknown function (DUF4238)
MAVLSHTIPKAYLKRFATLPKRAKIWVYERGRPPRHGAPKSEGTERGFFTARLPDGTFDDLPAESWAQKIEDNALDVLIHAPNQCFVWTRDTRKRMAEYWALFFLRTTTFFDFERNKAEGAFHAQMERLQSDSEFRGNLTRHYSSLSGQQLTEEEVLKTVERVVRLSSLRTS